MLVRAALLETMGLPRPYAQSRPLRIAAVELDPPGPGELLVRVRAAGLCHSDLSVVDGNRPRPMPMVLGHEAAGDVVALGPDTAGFAAGDHVVTTFVPTCGTCEPCTRGRPALCEPGVAANGAGTLLGGARRLHERGRELNHHLGVSGFAEYAVVDAHSAVRIDRDLPFDLAALFGCAVITGVGAVANTAAMPAGSRAAVVGLGGVGLAALLGARALGASTLVAVDVEPAKLGIAEQLGATHVFDARDPDCAAQVRAATRGGVEFAFEMAGSVRALDLAYRITRRGGTTVTAGLSPPDATFALPHVNLVAEERTLKGSYLGSCVPSRDVPRYVEWYRAGRLPVDRLIDARLELEQVNDALDRMASGLALRQVLMLG
jgi:alcohol dehydrogenase